jgi:uncharacterized protein (DUF58 family)
LGEALLQIDAELLAGSRDLMLLAECLVEGYAHGLHRSPYAGSSQEFATYRAFLPGDPLQRIDWKVYGRTDELFIREFEQETNLRGYLFLDASLSMDFGEGAGHKFTYARLLCAVLAVLMARQQDAPALALFGKGMEIPAEDWWPPSTRRDHLDHLVHHLETRSADGPADHLGGLPDLVDECHLRSLAVMITDALVDPDELKDTLSRLGMRGTKSILFHVLSREELEPKIDSDMVLVDRETGEERAVDGATYKRLHAENLARVCGEIVKVCHDTETEYCLMPTDQPLDEALRRFLLLRSGQ